MIRVSLYQLQRSWEGGIPNHSVLYSAGISVEFIWIESMLEELLDRGFLMNWLEKLFSTTSFATVIAVILQAVIFGFRHSYDFSARSITVGIIGLIMGIVYIKFGRNLWPLIIAHCILNSMSMIERVL